MTPTLRGFEVIQLSRDFRDATKFLKMQGDTYHQDYKRERWNYLYSKMRKKVHFTDAKLPSHNDVFFHGDFAFLMSYNDVCLHTVALSSCSDFLIRTFTQNCDCT